MLAVLVGKASAVIADGEGEGVVVGANGRWQLHSQADSGTTITVQLPLLGETRDR